jgi:hypothetical protein
MKMLNTMLKMMSDEMTINLDIYCALMENIIISNLCDTPIITMNRRTSGLRNTHVGQKPS